MACCYQVRQGFEVSLEERRRLCRLKQSAAADAHPPAACPRHPWASSDSTVPDSSADLLGERDEHRRTECGYPLRITNCVVTCGTGSESHEASVLVAAAGMGTVGEGAGRSTRSLEGRVQHQIVAISIR